MTDTGGIDCAAEPIAQIAEANGLPAPARESAIELIGAWYHSLRQEGYRHSVAEAYFCAAEH